MNLEHQEGNENCDCPTCTLTNKYLADYADYKARKTYLVIDSNPDGLEHAKKLEDDLNHANHTGYEMVGLIHGMSVMRKAPPEPPTPRDILMEIERRKEYGDADEVANDTIGECLGGLQ